MALRSTPILAPASRRRGRSRMAGCDRAHRYTQGWLWRLSRSMRCDSHRKRVALAKPSSLLVVLAHRATRGPRPPVQSLLPRASAPGARPCNPARPRHHRVLVCNRLRSRSTTVRQPRAHRPRLRGQHGPLRVDRGRSLRSAAPPPPHHPPPALALHHLRLPTLRRPRLPRMRPVHTPALLRPHPSPSPRTTSKIRPCSAGGATTIPRFFSSPRPCPKSSGRPDASDTRHPPSIAISAPAAWSQIRST